MTSTNPLIDGPDYTYLDGRKTPLRKHQKLRAIRQRDTVAKALQLTKEIEFAVQRHHNMNEAEKEERREVIKSKLKAKEFAFEWENKNKRGKAK